MALRIVHYIHRQQEHWGLVVGHRVIPVPGRFETTGEFILANTLASLSSLPDNNSVALSDIQLLSPVTGNQQFICLGANYRQHMLESGLDPEAKTFNMIFTKASSCITAADSPVVRPPHVKFLDYEIELGLVLRRDIRGPQTVTATNLHEFIAGIVMVNDYSARDIQIPQMQFYKGKSYRTFGPVGPYLCLLSREDMGYLQALQLTLLVNGRIRQQDSTANLVHGPADTLTELSGLQDLAAGDLIATGTPAGCALSIPSPLKQRLGALLPEAQKWALFLKLQARRSEYLQPGDVVEARIHSLDGAIDLGTQRNLIQEET